MFGLVENRCSLDTATPGPVIPPVVPALVTARAPEPVSAIGPFRVADALGYIDPMPQSGHLP